MIKSQMNPGTMDFHSDAQNMKMGGMRTSNYFRDEFPRPNNNFLATNKPFDESYHRRNMTHRPEDFQNRSQMGMYSHKQKGFGGKNSSVSMHNLNNFNNFGFLKESGSIKVQKNKERPSIFR